MTWKRKCFADLNFCFYIDEMSYLEILTVQEPWLAVKQNLPLKGKQRIPASCQHDLKGECTRGNPLFPKYLSGRN